MSDLDPINIVVFGSGAVGKSCITVQFTQARFIEDYDPTFEDQYTKFVVHDGIRYQFHIFDTSGEEFFETTRAPYIKTGNAFLIIYSIDDRYSFSAVERIYKTIIHVRGTDEIPMVICGNKCDLEKRRVVKTEEGEELCNRLKCPFFETSAKTYHNIHNAYHCLLDRYLELMKMKENKPNDDQEATNCKNPDKKDCILI
ncbi:small GTP-binding protein, putative [Trichomonas vaginalis G3]|uniref:small monomeric GTPase n=1 Tax=Trichomonas vaginalis (strain ATCC PRA-98 / G3) TaxID=412133 RepID=A2G0V9_TRIV3|nr:GTPase protein [Trichomonas vaginalis G3]EAX89205.1 small GTP-binding protein, putative [Trichomonas vaginalis G3]KAI5551339.1 GTPase protein [Trichomonas vaginalis G3]|eukprot:XP_001302135.1 small GTP-binding protein [Trichomonas vaginalis G3]